jgi:hypothetical protein
MRSAPKSNIITLIVGVLAGVLLFGGVSVAHGIITSSDIKDGTIKKRDLSKGVKRSISNKATDKELAALAARVAKLEADQEAVDNGLGNRNFSGGAGTTVTENSASVTIENGGANSVESPNLDVAVQAGDVITFDVAYSNGAVCDAGAPRFFAEVGGTFYNSYDVDNSTNCAGGTAPPNSTNGTITFTIPVNGRIGQAGFVYDNGIAGTVVFSNLTIDGKSIPLT